MSTQALPELTTDKEFVIHYKDDEHFTVTLNGQHIGDADHDKNGWAGMEDVEKIIANISAVLGIPVRVTHAEEDNS